MRCGNSGRSKISFEVTPSSAPGRWSRRGHPPAGGSPKNLLYMSGKPNQKLDNATLTDDLERSNTVADETPHVRVNTGQQIVVDGIQPAYLLFLVVAQGMPVEGGNLAVPAELTSVLEGVAEFGRVHVKLLRHTTHVDAGAAHIAVLRDGNPGAEARSHAGGPDAA